MAQLTDPSGRPHSGIVPYPVPAVVTDNDDPDKLGRIKVKFPTLHGEPFSFWIRQVSPNAGKERGLYALPEKGDEVLVLFMLGSQDIGVIIGQFWNGVDIPPAEAIGGMPKPADLWAGQWSKDKFTAGSTDDADNDRRFWRSRSGHLLAFDDTKGSETVHLWDKSHKLALVFDTANSAIFLSNSGGDIHVRAKNDLYLEAGNNMKVKIAKDLQLEAGMNTKWKAGMDHTFEAGMNAKHKAGMNYEIEAGMNFKAKASLAAKIEGSLTFDAKGGLSAKLEGGAMAAVKGGIVTIN